MSDGQKADVFSIFDGVKNNGNLDYVSCWYKKAADMMTDTTVRTALVSTNSITQGEQVAILWKNLFENGVHIDFAHRTFRWDSEASIKAHVHCVIVGFSKANNSEPKRLYDNGVTKVVSNINGYLIEADDVVIDSRKKAISDVPEIGIGNMPLDGGFYLFTEEEKAEFIKKEPNSEKWFRPWIGSQEFINRFHRYCLYLKDCNPAELRKLPECMKRVNAVKEYRESSNRASTKKLANYPLDFATTNIPIESYIVIPKVSSERRRYIPIGYIDSNVLSSDLVFIIPDATLYHFGVLTSNVHMAWVRAVCGRLEMRYRYSKDIVYNNFPWCNPTPEQKAKIEQTAQAILDARELYPDCSLADLYDETVMPPELRKAHQANDRAVMAAYGFDVKTMTESSCVAELMKMYQNIVNENS